MDLAENGKVFGAGGKWLRDRIMGGGGGEGSNAQSNEVLLLQASVIYGPRHFKEMNGCKAAALQPSLCVAQPQPNRKCVRWIGKESGAGGSIY